MPESILPVILNDDGTQSLRLQQQYRYRRSLLSELSWTLAELAQQITHLEHELAHCKSVIGVARLDALRQLHTRLRSQALQELLQVEQLAARITGAHCPPPSPPYG